MKLGALEISHRDGALVGSVPVSWEDSDRPALVVEVAVPDDTSPPTIPIDAFLSAAVVADLHGERRLAVADPVDPRLAENLLVALATLRSWFGDPGPVLQLEATTRVPSLAPGRPTGYLMTGGIDSSALLVHNHRVHAVGDPFRITTGVVVYGLDASTAGDLRQPDPFLLDLAGSAGLEVLPVATTIRSLDLSWATWQKRTQMAILAGAAHATGPAISHLLVAASDNLAQLVPYGTHPQLDQRFSSTGLQVHHELSELNRTERVRLVASSPAAMASLQVCNAPRADWLPGGLNCGQCEKCIRTLVGLRAVGARDAPSFPRPPVTADEVAGLRLPAAIPVGWPIAASGARVMVPPAELMRAGEPALAEAVERLSHRLLRRERLRSLRRGLRRTAGHVPGLGRR